MDDAGSWSFDYDCAGNMTTRNVGAGQYTLTYNEENKLAEVKLNGATQATYTYDGDGTLVKKVVNGQTTVYVGAHFEKNVSTGEVTKYYTLGNRRVAMRKGGLLTYLRGDHLGSASMTTNALGGVGDEMRYYPYGDTRSGTIVTDRRFTGQREETAIGLYDYKARYYDPVIGRFIQADTGNQKTIAPSRSRGTRRRSTGMRMCITIRSGIRIRVDIFRMMKLCNCSAQNDGKMFWLNFEKVDVWEVAGDSSYCLVSFVGRVVME